MVSLSKRLAGALSRRFNGADVRLKRYRVNNRIGGTLIWEGFDGEQQIDRQIKLHRAIDEILAEKERSKVSFILTVTPLEFDSISED